MVIHGGNPSTQMDGLVGRFRSEEINSIAAEAIEEYMLASEEASYKDPGEQAPMGFMAAGGGFHHGYFLTGGIINTPHFLSRISYKTPTGRPPPCA